MKIDPVLAARVRKMVFDESSWPGERLSMKKFGEMDDDSFGQIHKGVDTNYIEICRYNGDPLVIFGSIEDLIAAGWVVD